MRIYAVVIGKRPDNKPYIAYDNYATGKLAVFDTKKRAKEFIFDEYITHGRIVRFDERMGK